MIGQWPGLLNERGTELAGMVSKHAGLPSLSVLFKEHFPTLSEESDTRLVEMAQLYG